MAKTAFISVDEYLNRYWEPDCEYANDQVVERAWGDHDHSWLQLEIGSFLRAWREQTGAQPLTEQRLKLGPKLYRIPDICLIKIPYKREPVLTTPPLVCIEILSPGESTLSILRKVSEYPEFGVAAVWVIDPAKQKVKCYDKDGLHYPYNKTLTLPVSGIPISFRPLFQKLHQA